MTEDTRTDSRPRRVLRWAAILALLAIGLCLVAGVLAPYLVAQWPYWQARGDQEAYDQAVERVSGGSRNGEMALLPPEYQELSPARDGAVLVYQNGAVKRVLFYLDGPSPFTTYVYMYASDDQPMDMHGECSAAERERPNWSRFHCP
jgi:hypothetical protein